MSIVPFRVAPVAAVAVVASSPAAALDRLPAVQRSIERSIQKLPTLGLLNPDGALLIERTIDDYMPTVPSTNHPDATTTTTITTYTRERIASSKARIAQSRAILAKRRHVS